MKKIFFLLAVATVLTVKADYLYWMVDTPATVTTRDGQTVDNYQWTSAILKQDGEQLATLSYSNAEWYKGKNSYAYADIGSSGSSYNDSTTFIIELYNDAASPTYVGNVSATAATLAQYIFKSDSMAPIGSAGAFGVGATFAVPEPTSGLLFIIGGMLLGLKRRREVV